MVSNSSKKIIVTGANGFVGKALCANLSKYDYFNFIPLAREPLPFSFKLCPDLNQKCGWSELLTGADVVIHLAGKAHEVSGASSLEGYRSVNTYGTINLAKQALIAGVKKFIFMSSIGVNGISNSFPFKYNDEPTPIENYAISKYEAEIELKKIAKNTDMEVVIIRPPLVYGKNAQGNFGTLLNVADRNLPLPLGAINNQRSFVAIDNLVDLIVTCIDHPNAVNQTFLVSDDENISTSNFLKKLTLAAGKKPWLIPIPVSFLKLIASIVGKKATVERFSSSLTVDIEHTKNTLNWKPPITLEEGIRRCFK
ncbi:MAG: NAD-dependent epimerase/dehydratase family protein [Pseudoalteromonas nigrifaciens]|uniref:NAD-dependent epimerase/dehydratase family protein n=1 Tax=Pseudoalteromonas nigrifaciens TaxID=28109 RepID=UPI003F97A5B5